jgi:hypothetical protein
MLLDFTCGLYPISQQFNQRRLTMARAVADMDQITSNPAIFPESGKTVPSLARMIRDARADQQVIKRATQEALRLWFRQSERLNIARREYKLRGPRFVDFARRIGISDQTTAYQLVHLHRYRAKIISKCVEDAAVAAKRGQIYRYPGWETALGWVHKPKRIQRSGR